MLRAISFKIYELRRYLVLSLVISMMAIPIANSIVIERDRNRNEMYGEAFWIYGFGVYNMTDTEVAEALDPTFGYDDGLHTLPEYLGNVKYEYPVFGLIFFAIATWIFPGGGPLQPLWLNFLMTLVFHLNLVLIAILLKERLYEQEWARLFVGGYYVYGLIMSAGGGKLEPLVDCLFLMALVLHQEKQYGKSMFTLGLAFQTKIYPAVAFPVFFLVNPLSSVWFFISMIITVVPLTMFGVGFDSLIKHFLNTSEYSQQIVNPTFPGLVQSPILPDATSSYLWLPALIPVILYIAFVLYTFPLYLPEKKEFFDASLYDKFKKLIPLYVYLLPGILFVFRWVMPWYLMWLSSMIFVFKSERHSHGYIKHLTIVGLVYAYGVLVNLPYFLSGPLPDFLGHFPLGWLTLLGMALLVVLSVIAFVIWSKEMKKREYHDKLVQEAEARGELVI
ncbi:MAG: hypothetical protein GF411_07215 [Candidatus Lokiarchaeota archaeon]|nr:hypothetical protein [Candidatus Lokiarchaeota archaeon]